MKPKIDYERLREITEERGKRMLQDSKLSEKIVEARLVSDYLKVAHARNFTIVSDEPVESGGKNLAPQPTEYFLAGVAFCELSIYARYAALLGVKVDSIDITIKGRLSPEVFWTRMRIGQKIPQFRQIIIETKIRSPETPDRVKELVTEVEGRCPLYNSLINPLPVETVIYHNDEKLEVHESPATLTAVH